MSEETTPKPPVSDLLEGLFYPSESDEPVEFVTFSVCPDPPLTVGRVKEVLLITPETFVEEIPEDQFWAPVVNEEEWFGPEEKERASRFRKLQEVVQEQLAHRQAFRVGKTEIDLYLLGARPDGTWAGLKTLVVET
ncbi:nuclease A inhibitor family protein [Larkinella soli]|uniref:nuclease A inhibitor family protein n=1 Tax=Larkinella soli TaxID=1770527 RepID=UPI000FFC75B6|nr:nuclease A inhibitor family protein [Larkinella soli]